jgi:hypothetical protein
MSLTHARASPLRAGKGINLPDSTLPIPALTAKDLADLTFIATHADIVALSFVRRPHDVADLQARLAALGRDDLGVILKIETLQGFEYLPQILLTALRNRRVGVMIARGDLAVECGYRRLAELQEEILWLCEAAHIPVIWATQVLDQLARTGRPTRAETSGMGGRSWCTPLTSDGRRRRTASATGPPATRTESSAGDVPSSREGCSPPGSGFRVPSALWSGSFPRLSTCRWSRAGRRGPWSSPRIHPVVPCPHGGRRRRRTGGRRCDGGEAAGAPSARAARERADGPGWLGEPAWRERPDPRTSPSGRARFSSCPARLAALEVLRMSRKRAPAGRR